MTAPRTGRRSGGPDTRGEILAAARSLFAESSYERTTIRAVASRAGVDPALVHHYFGTKVGLLAAAGKLPLDPAVLLAGVAEHPEQAGYEIARRVLGLYETVTPAREALLGLIRSAVSNEAAAADLREVFTDTIHAELRAIVADDTASLRASLIASQIGGLALARYIVGFPGVAEAPLDDLVAAVGPVLQHYVTGDLRAAGGVRPAPGLTR